MTTWRVTRENPRRVESEYGVVEDLPRTPLVKAVPAQCPHEFRMMSMADARMALEVQQGKCRKCAKEKH